MSRLSTGPTGGTKSTFIWALALFVILCGAVLVTAGEDVSASDRGGVKSALKNLEQAANALEATDYGKTRTHLRKAREQLSQLVD